MRASGISLWLVPEVRAFGRFSRSIDAWSSRFSTPRFDPHVTLLGGLTPTRGILRRSRELASKLPVLTLEVIKASAGPSYFQSVFLSLRRTPALRTARREAAAIFGVGPIPFRPHLSFVYGILPKARREALAASLPRFPPFQVWTLAVVRTEGPPERWKKLGSFPLERIQRVIRRETRV